MSFVNNDAPPVVAFVGRPLDPLKGLQTYFDALETLLSLKTPPRFVAWIVGGDRDEVPKINAMLLARPPLRAELLAGRIFVWGKVQRGALPEFYRRCAVLIMPSLREPLGLVAIEAMACGVPVVGTCQGGLDDTIIGGLSGAKAELDSPEAVAAAALLLLRNPALRDARGRIARAWASQVFSKEETYGRMVNLYDPSTIVPPMAEVAWDLRAKFHDRRVEECLGNAERLLDCRILSRHTIAARYHVVARIETEKGAFALKAFRDRPSLSAALFPVGRSFAGRMATDLVDNAIFHAENPTVPKLVAYDRQHGFVIFEWADISELANPANRFREVCDAFAQHGKRDAWRWRQQEEAYWAVLGQFLLEPDERFLTALDDASIELNRAVHGGSFGQRHTHPIAELRRILMSLEQKGWPIPEDVADRIRMVINMILARKKTYPNRLSLCHGDLKAKHIVSISDQPRIIDTEHSTMAIGNLDLGAFAAAEARGGVNMFNITAMLRQMTDGEEDYLSALDWTAYFIIYEFLARVHHGKVSEPIRFIRRVLADFALTL